MSAEFLKMFELQQHIYGVCPHSGKVFRLSECQLFLGKAPKPDWFDLLRKEEQALVTKEEKLIANKAEIQEEARIEGRALAARSVKKIDPVFTPRKLNPDDAKVLFHPVDYVVFNGMKEGEGVSEIMLLDRRSRNQQHRHLQKSIEKAITKQRFDWQTLRVENSGAITKD
jgi:predicted Holliday junction resolvase-like endonuclease